MYDNFSIINFTYLTCFSCETNMKNSQVLKLKIDLKVPSGEREVCKFGREELKKIIQISFESFNAQNKNYGRFLLWELGTKDCKMLTINKEVYKSQEKVKTNVSCVISVILTDENKKPNKWSRISMREYQLLFRPPVKCFQ